MATLILKFEDHVEWFETDESQGKLRFHHPQVEHRSVGQRLDTVDALAARGRMQAEAANKGQECIEKDKSKFALFFGDKEVTDSVDGAIPNDLDLGLHLIHEASGLTGVILNGLTVWMVDFD